MAKLTDELLEQLRFEYWAAREALCQTEPPWGRLQARAKVVAWPSFYDYLCKRGWSRFQLSAYGIGRDIAA